MESDLLVIGGGRDPNILRLIETAETLGINVQKILLGARFDPDIVLNLHEGVLYVGGVAVRPKSVFIRPDVFEYMATNDKNESAIASDWFNIFIGWMLANPDINIFNRRYFHRNAVNKIETLLIAKSLGFLVPETYFTNSVGLINDLASVDNAWIEKPIVGGAHAKFLEKREQGARVTPVTVQTTLIQPEIRIFRVGNDLLSFSIASEKLDYRDSTAPKVEFLAVPEAAREPFIKLTDALGLDFAGADFKTDPKTGALALLEVNSGPMFAGFDMSTVNRNLTTAMVQALVRGF